MRKIKNLNRLLPLVVALACAVPTNAQDDIVCTFNASSVILPSSYYTPDEPYKATVWVKNTGNRYDSNYYNHVWGVPDADEQGRQWYEPDYELTDNEVIWEEDATAPFSSDEYYLGHKSYRWVVSDIMGDMYMRRSFTLSEPITGKVYLACGHDDAPSEWYINGTQVYTVADGWKNEEYVLLTDEQAALIKTDGSENILAVHVHQNWGGAFADCGLYAADMSTVHYYLPTVASGAWDCAYYYPNYNEDLDVAVKGQWFALEEDEEDWIKGVGPFSVDENMFYTTEWPSTVRPILVRRHFTLTAADLQAISSGTLKFTCSYDEYPTAYLNGNKLWSATGWNDNDYAEHTVDADMKKNLRVGDNVLAVQLQQGSGGGHIDYGLYLSSKYVPTSIGNAAAAAQKSVEDGRIYDLSGRSLGTSAGKLQRGIYIKNGKKYVVNK